MPTFIECTSISIGFNVMGQATVTYTVVSDSSGFKIIRPVTFGGRTFNGYVASAYNRQIPNTSWYETNVTLMATT